MKTKDALALALMAAAAGYLFARHPDEVVSLASALLSRDERKGRQDRRKESADEPSNSAGDTGGGTLHLLRRKDAPIEEPELPEREG